MNLEMIDFMNFKLPTLVVASFLLVVVAVAFAAVNRSIVSNLREKAARAEREAIMQQMAAKQLEKERFLDEFRQMAITNLSHELRTPVTLVLGYIQMIMSGEFGSYDDRMNDPLETIHSNARRINIIAKRTASLAHRGLDIRPFNLADVVDSVLTNNDIWLSTRRDELNTTLEFAREQPVIVEADESKVWLAVYELVNNAIKFGDLECHQTVTIRVYEDDEFCIVQVSDIGIGIERKDYQRIFEPMFQVNMTSSRPYEGVGLGLSVVSDVAYSHGGHVEVVSELGNGSTFRLVLPQK